MNTAAAALPRWNLSNVYSGIESAEFARDLRGLEETLDLIDQHEKETLRACTPETPASALATALVLAGCKSIPVAPVERPAPPVMACVGTLV